MTREYYHPLPGERGVDQLRVTSIPPTGRGERLSLRETVRRFGQHSDFAAKEALTADFVLDDGLHFSQSTYPLFAGLKSIRAIRRTGRGKGNHLAETESSRSPDQEGVYRANRAESSSAML